MAAPVGRPASKRRIEMPDGSMVVYTKDGLDKHLNEAIIEMASTGKTKYDDEVKAKCKTQGEIERQNEAICLHGKTVADLLKIKELGGVIEQPDNK